MSERPNQHRALGKASASATRRSEPVETAGILANDVPKAPARPIAAKSGESKPSGRHDARARNDSKPSSRYDSRIGPASKPSESLVSRFGASRSLRKTRIRTIAHPEPVSKGDAEIVSLVPVVASTLQGTIRMFSRVDNGVARSTSRAPLADMGVGADRSRVFQGNTRVTRFLGSAN